VSDPLEPEVVAGDTEEVDALLVDAEGQTVVPRVLAPAPAPARTIVPAVQAAAVAATGFVAGRRLGRARRNRGPEVLQVVNTRSLLVDVHLLGGPEGR
jgi:hypothetical protein